MRIRINGNDVVVPTGNTPDSEQLTKEQVTEMITSATQDKVSSIVVKDIVVASEAEYESLTKSETTLYLIPEES